MMCAIFSLELLACEKEPEVLEENIDYLPEAEIVKDEPEIQEENNLELDIEDDVAIQYSPVSGEDYTLTETAVDEILSEADADKNWSAYNDFFEMRVENTESTLNGTKYTGYVFDDNQPEKKVPVEFEVDGEKHLIIK